MSNIRHIRRTLAITAVCAALPTAAQSTVHDPRAIDEQVAAFLGAGTGEPGGARSPVDRRLRLAACPGPLELSRPMSAEVVVACRAMGWRLRVPVAVSGRGAEPTARNAGLVARGDQVQLFARRGLVSVVATGVALDGGGAGDRIRVRVGDRRAVIAGYVQPDGRVSTDALNSGAAAP